MLTTCDLEILNFGKEHLVGVLAGTKDTRSTSTRAHLLHLGGHLIGGCVTSSQHTYQSQEYFWGGHTIIAPQYVIKYRAQPKQV